MSVERDAMIYSLKQIVIPVLRKKGFKGSFPHFYRKLDKQTDLLMFQFSMWGGVLYVEIANCPSEGYISKTDGEYYPSNKMRVYYVDDHPGLSRYRIGRETKGMFEFNESVTDEAAYKVLYALDEAEEWWGLYKSRKKSHP